MDQEKQTHTAEKLSPLLFQSSLVHDVAWFITLRWFAAIGVLAFTTALTLFSDFTYFCPFMIIAGATFTCNVLYIIAFYFLGRIKQRRLAYYEAFANLQIGIDWLLLTVLVYYTGGIISPFIFFYIFHIIISAILLPKLECYIQTVFAMLLVGVLTFFQFYGIIPYKPFATSSSLQIADHSLYFIIFYAFFCAMLLISSFFAITLSGRLRRKNNELEQLRLDLETAIAKLKTQDEELTKLTFKTTHELRAPLNAIQSLLNLMQQGYSGKLPERMKELIVRASARVAALVKMTSQLLDIAKKSEISKEEKTLVDLSTVLKHVFDFFSPHAETKELKYDLVLPARKVIVSAREEDMQRLFSNLVENAIKYTPKGKNIRVDLRRHRKNAIITVEDTGIGIPRESQANIFDRFYRAPNARNQETVGTGLGLALIKRLVDSYDGNIMFTSEQGEGSTFTIILPMMPEEEG